MASTADLLAQVAAAQQSASAAGLISARLQTQLAELTQRVDQLEAHVSVPPVAGAYEAPSAAVRSLALGVVVQVPAGIVPSMITEVIATALRNALGDDAACLQRGMQLTHEPVAALAIRLGLADEAALAEHERRHKQP